MLFTDNCWLQTASITHFMFSFSIINLSCTCPVLVLCLSAIQWIGKVRLSFPLSLTISGGHNHCLRCHTFVATILWLHIYAFAFLIATIFYYLCIWQIVHWRMSLCCYAHKAEHQANTYSLEWVLFATLLTLLITHWLSRLDVGQTDLNNKIWKFTETFS